MGRPHVGRGVLTVVDSQSTLLTDVEGILVTEARAMDDHDYDRWMSLWTDELLYWIPCDGQDFDPEHHVSIAYDDRATLEKRVDRLKGKHAFSQRPQSRLLRSISNIVIQPSEQKVFTTSVFVLGEVRNGLQTIYMGRNEHTLIRVGDEFRIQQKKVLLLNADASLNNLTFLL